MKKTAETILREHVGVANSHWCEPVLKAMEEYASQNQQGWIPCVGGTSWGDPDRVVVFFDTGEVRFFQEDWPFAVNTHYTVLPPFPDERGEKVIAESRDKWIPISESLPEDRHWCIVFANKELFLAVYKHGIFETEQPRILQNVTHWQPLPSPPNNQ